MGIEPTSKAWEAFVLPLNYTRMVKLWSYDTLNCRVIEGDYPNSEWRGLCV